MTKTACKNTTSTCNIPTWKYQHDTRCMCRGTGTLTTCQTSGLVNCDGSTHADCRECDATQKVACPECEGNGSINDQECPTCKGAEKVPCQKC